MASRAAPAPCTSAIARARLIATTGEPASANRASYSCHLGPGVTCAAAINVRRLQCAFRLVATKGAQNAGTPEQRLGLIHDLRVPTRRFLLGKRQVNRRVSNV